MSLNRLVNIGIFWHETPMQTPIDFFKGDVLVGSSGGGDSSTEIYPKLLNLLAGTKFKVVTGYKGNGESHARDGARRGLGHRRHRAVEPAGDEARLDSRPQGADRGADRPDELTRHSRRAVGARSGQGRGGRQDVRASPGAAGEWPARSRCRQAPRRMSWQPSGRPSPPWSRTRHSWRTPRKCAPTSVATGDEIAGAAREDLRQSARSGRARQRRPSEGGLAPLAGAPFGHARIGYHQL